MTPLEAHMEELRKKLMDRVLQDLERDIEDGLLEKIDGKWVAPEGSRYKVKVAEIFKKRKEK